MANLYPRANTCASNNCTTKLFPALMTNAKTFVIQYPGQTFRYFYSPVVKNYKNFTEGSVST